MKIKEDKSIERLNPGIYNEISIEHLHRYALAIELGNGKNILDIACGEGYGTNLLAKEAKHVTGIDICETTISQARIKYPNKNISFTTADIKSIPLPDKSIDLIVCFETIEHVNNQNNIISELKRVLKTNGLLVISTPNKEIYNDRRNYSNPFHTKEFYKPEFEDLLKASFKEVEILEQMTSFTSIVYGKQKQQLDFYQGDFNNISKVMKLEPMYYIAIASDSALPIIAASVFSGEQIIETALANKEKMIKSTISFRLGHFLLYPVKWLWKLFNK